MTVDNIVVDDWMKRYGIIIHVDHGILSTVVLLACEEKRLPIFDNGRFGCNYRRAKCIIYLITPGQQETQSVTPGQINAAQQPITYFTSQL